ncbi:MAG: hypothetical protein WAV31_00295 [Candidatus Moraniibacteriota bacterium]
MKKIILGSFLFLAASIFSGCASTTDDSAIILFYSNECSHCKIVEKYIADNNIKDKISFSQREVGSDSANANLMVDKQKSCNWEKEKNGKVPFLWTDGKCYLGQDEIIQFFKDKINVQ